MFFQISIDIILFHCSILSITEGCQPSQNKYHKDATGLKKFFLSFIHTFRHYFSYNFQTKYHFLTFPADFYIPIIFSNLNYSCPIFWDLRNLQEQVKKAFCYQKLLWPFTVWINCSSDLKIFENSRPSASNFKSFSQSLEQFFLTVGQNNFGNKIPFIAQNDH